MGPLIRPTGMASTGRQNSAHAQEIFRSRERLYWVIGGAGSGKTTVCRALAGQTGLQIYDMDTHIYGDYHGRFTAERHPVNQEWSHSGNGLTWLMDRSWDSFLEFNQKAAAEYLDLLAEDLQQLDPDRGLLIDGGIFTPSIATRVIPPSRFVCISTPWRSSTDIWEGSPERLKMKSAFQSFPDPESAWRKFLEFDRRITAFLAEDSAAAGIQSVLREQNLTVPELAIRIRRILQI